METEKKVQADWFGPRLRELRTRAGLTRKQLAERAGLSEDGISQWERGVREPGWSVILTLCAALGVDCTAFTQEPAGQPAPTKGRPRKTVDTTAEVVGKSRQQPKKPRGKKKEQQG